VVGVRAGTSARTADRPAVRILDPGDLAVELPPLPPDFFLALELEPTDSRPKITSNTPEPIEMFAIV